MKTVFYSKIIPAETQTLADIIRKAHVLGYELVQFNGYDNDDLGSSGNHGPRWNESREQKKMAMEITDACEVIIDGACDFPHIIQTKHA